MTTATRRPRQAHAVEPAMAQRLRQRIANDLTVQQAVTRLAELQTAESAQIVILKTPPTPEDPHAHDQAREKLKAVREELAAAEKSVTDARKLAAKAVEPELAKLHAEAATGLVEGLAATLAGINGLLESQKNQAIVLGARGDVRKFPAFGLSQLLNLRPQLQQILRMWQQQ